jgi:AmiR/NasT family two-component response regulator
MRSRSTVDLALRVIMGQNHTTREEALEILRAASQSRNVKLREVAALIIQDLTGHPPVDPPPFNPGPGAR